MKYAILVCLLVMGSNSIFGQVLVRFGDQTISKNEFISAFRKNNLKTKAGEKAFRDYLDLYIRYRLKVKAAYDLGLDTGKVQITELQNFKSQIADQYTNDESSLNLMAREAFIRSQKDLRISYIFVAAAKNALPQDTVKAWLKIREAYQALKSGRDFNETAIQFSEDPFVKNNSGDLQFITVFDLPYAMESVAYQTMPGKYSPIFRIDGGYIILKKTAERHAAGRIRIAQILLVFPYQASESAKENTKQRADSIFRALKAGSDFGELAKKFSGDNLSYQLGGTLPEFGIGRYEADFENTAYDLKKDGDISEPYRSSLGYHIIKRIKRIPVPAKVNQKILDDMKEKIKTDPRIAVSRNQMLKNILKQTGFKAFIPAGRRLWEYTDSSLQNKRPAESIGLNEQSILFQISDKKFPVAGWIAYRKSLSSTSALTTGKANPEIFDLYLQNVSFDYYREHLEKYNKTFETQVNEFRDGNLLFEIMQLMIWNRAVADSVGLQKYFQKHNANYWWKPGVEAIIFSADNQQTAEKLRGQLVKNINRWRKLVDSLGGQIQADSGRFDLNHIPVKGMRDMAGRFTVCFHSMSSEKTDHSVRFAYIIRNYQTASLRTFEEARGLVINDYQNELENNWIASLKKKYPVEVNKTVFESLTK